MRGRPLFVAAVLAAACESSIAPPAVVRIEPATATALYGTVGTEVTPAPTVRALDEDGRPVAGVDISFQVGNGGAIAQTAVQTGADGLATAGTWVLGPAVGNQTVTARSGVLVAVVFTAIAQASTVTQILRLGGNDQIAAPRQKVCQPLRARVADSFGNPIVGAPVTFTVIAGEGSIENGGGVTRWDGVAVSGPWTLGSGAGVQQVKAESGTAQVVFSAHANSGPTTGLLGQLAFVAICEGNAEIYVINADRSGLRQLTTNPGSDYDPAWSPDGSQIAFASDRDGRPNIYVMTADGANVTRRTRGQFDDAPAWSPSGSAIAFATSKDGSSEIATVGNADGTIAFLTDYPGYESQPAWSPDGRQLAFVSDYIAYDFVFNIHTMNADGTSKTLRTKGFDFWPNLVYYLHPAWSPDGSTIAFVYGRIINRSDVRFNVAVMSADGRFIKNLAWAGDIPWLELRDPGSLTWSPDGRSIAYTFVDCDLSSLLSRLSCSGERSVNYVSLDGNQQGRIVSTAHSPSWRR